MLKKLFSPFFLFFLLCFFAFSSDSRAQWTYYPQCTCDEYDPVGSPCLTYAYVCYNEKQDFTYETSGYTRGSWRFTATVYNPCNTEADTKIRYGYTGIGQEIYINDVAVDTVSIPPNSSKNFYKTLTFDAWWSCDYYYSYGCVSLLVNKQNQLFWGRGSYEVRTDQVPACPPAAPTATPTPLPACPYTYTNSGNTSATNLLYDYNPSIYLDFTPDFTAGLERIDIFGGLWNVRSGQVTCKLERGTTLLGEATSSVVTGLGIWISLNFSSPMCLTNGITYRLSCKQETRSIPQRSAYWNKNGEIHTYKIYFPQILCDKCVTPTPTPTPQPTATPTPQPTPTPACTTYYWQVEADNSSLSGLSLIRNFQVCISADSWFQTKEGDVHAGGEIGSTIPVTATNRNFSTNDASDPGIVSYGTSVNFGNGYPSGYPSDITGYHWLVQTTNPRKSFAYFYSLLDSPPLNPPPDPDDDPGGLASEIDDTHFSDGGIYAYNGDIATVDDGWDIGNKKIVVLTNRGFLIKGRIKIDTANGGSLVVIAQDNIGIDKNLVATGGVQNKFQGIFITDGIFNTSVEPDTYNFSSATSNKILVIDGLVVANSFTLGRDFSALGGGDYNNNTTPAETFRYDPTLVMNTHQGLWNYLHSWKELTP